MYKPSSYRAKPLSRNNLERIANSLRKILGIENVLKVDVISLLENILLIFDSEFYLEIVPDDELDAHARTFPESHKILIIESAYEGARRGKGRDRYTIVHEFFHYIWHDKEQISLARNPEEIKVYENPEWQADAFAGYFLMPTHLIKGKTVNWVAKECGVSEKAARRQLEIVNKKTEYKTPSF